MVRKVLVFAALVFLMNNFLLGQSNNVRAFGLPGENKQITESTSPLEDAVKEAIKQDPIQLNLELFIPNTQFKLPEAYQRNEPIDESKVVYLTLKNAVASQITRNLSPTLSLRLPLPSGEIVELELFRKNPFTQGAVVKTSDGDEFPIADGAYYRGVIKNDPGSVVGIAIQEGEIIGVVASRKYGQFNIAKLDDFPEIHAIYSEDIYPPDINVGCQDAIEIPKDAMKSVEEEVDESRSNHASKCVKVYIETNRALFTNKGSVNNVINYVNSIFNNVSIIYQNEEINSEISEIFVWTTPDPYPTNVNSALTAFRQNRANAFNGDIAHLFLLNGSGGGVAYLNVLCSPSWAFAVSNINASYNNFPNYSWTIMVVSHEMGHNLGSNHTQWCGWPGGAIDNCYETEGNCGPGPAPTNGGTIMSYCHLTSSGINFLNGFGTLPGNRIRQRVGQVNCLDTGCGNLCLGFDATVTVGNTSCGLGNGTLQLNITGGDSPYQVNIGSGFTTQTSFSNLAAGTYNILIVDANDCEASVSATIQPSTPLNLNVSTQPTSCGLDNGAINVNVLQSNGAVTYNLGFGNTQNPNYNNLPSGNYTLNATDNNGCTFTGTYNIGASSPIEVFETTYPTSCGLDNGAVFISTSGGSGTGNIWVDLNYSNNYQNLNYWEGLAAGSYHASIIDDATCTAEIEFEITASNEITVEAVTTSTSCGLNNGSVELFISGGSGNPYQVELIGVSGPSTQSNFNNLAPNTYHFQISDNGGCNTSGSFIIYESDPVNLQTTIELPTCGLSNGSISATISQPVASFTLNGNSQTSGVFNNLPSGIYTLTAQSTSGCSETVTIELFTESTLETEVTTQGAFCGEPGQITVSVLQAGSYFFDIGQGSQANPTFTGLAAGNYSITISDTQDCLDVLSVTLEGSDALSVTSKTVNTTCGQENGSFEMTVSGGTGPYTYFYNNLPLSGSSGTNIPAGNYSVTVTDAYGCEMTNGFTINSSNALTAELSNQNTTCGKNNGAISIQALTGTSPYIYTVGNETNATGNFENLAAGEYFIFVTDNAGCSISFTTNIQNSQPLLASVIVQSPQCNNSNGSVTVSATPNTPGLTYQLNGVISNDSQFSNIGAGTYTLLVENELGCKFEDVITLTNQWTPAVVDFTVIRNGLAIEIVNNSLGTSNTYEWTFGDGATSTVQNPSHEYSSIGQYQICLEIANPCGTVTECRSLNVFLLSECRVIDSLALVELYHATKGEEWTIQWDLNQQVNLWHGINFGQNGCIEAILLPDNNLQGYLPVTIGNLSSINRLDLSSNFIADTIPSEVRFINTLTQLNLSNNNLSGIIDPRISDLVNLQVLQLQGNNFNGVLPANINKMRLLHWLDVSNNQLGGNIPTGITALERLEYLSLANNMFEGGIPANIVALKELRAFYLNNNQLSGNIPAEIAGMDSLQALWIQNNRFDNLPDISSKNGFKDEPQLGFRVENNKFTFTDVLPNISLFEDQEYSFYAPQAKVYRDTTIRARPGDHIVLDIEVDKDIQGVSYDWYLVTDLMYSFQESVFELTNFSVLNQGTYVAKLSHPIAPDLILETYPVRLELDQSTSTENLTGSSKISLLPNPVSTGSLFRLDIESSIATRWKYVIMDISGKIIQQNGIIEVVAGRTVESIAAPQLPGAYILMLQCENTGNHTSMKLITY